MLSYFLLQDKTFGKKLNKIFVTVNSSDKKKITLSHLKLNFFLKLHFVMVKNRDQWQKHKIGLKYIFFKKGQICTYNFQNAKFNVNINFFSS